MKYEYHQVSTGLRVPVVYILELHGKPQRAFRLHRDGEKALLLSPGKGWALASYHPDKNSLPLE